MVTAEEIMERDGCSRATAYRKLAKMTAAEKKADPVESEDDSDSPPPPPEVAEPDAGDDNVIKAWSIAVLWAVEHLHRKSVKQTDAPSPLSYSMWKHGRKDQRWLLDQVPKAATLRSKLTKGEDIEGYEQLEQADIRELESLLDAAVVEAGLA